MAAQGGKGGRKAGRCKRVRSAIIGGISKTNDPQKLGKFIHEQGIPSHFRWIEKNCSGGK